MSEVILKPCPFCRGEALSSVTSNLKLPAIECINCHATMLATDTAGAPALARKWNTRAPAHNPVANNIDAEKERIAKKIAEAAGLTSKSTSP